jgi:hypothetical protein
MRPSSKDSLAHQALVVRRAIAMRSALTPSEQKLCFLLRARRSHACAPHFAATESRGARAHLPRSRAVQSRPASQRQSRMLLTTVP